MRQIVKRAPYPGTIYQPKNNNRLYIEYTDEFGKRRRIATGLRADQQESWEHCVLMLKRIYMRRHKLDELTGTRIIEKAPPTVEEALEKFTATYDANVSTTRLYRYAIRLILGDMEARVNEKMVERALERFSENESVAPVTRASYLKWLRVFLSFCAVRGWLPHREWVKT